MVILKDVPKTGGKYKISNSGIVYSYHFKNRRKLKPYNDKGKMIVNVKMINGKQKIYHIHTLVYRLFKDKIPTAHYVYHIDGNIYNNHIDNLGLIRAGKNKNPKEPLKLEEEIWKVINGFSDYRISNLGRVYSTKINAMLKLSVDKNGYQIVRIIDTKQKEMKVHRLVAANFIKKIPKNMVVDHIDRNKVNNNLLNLRIVTCSENNYNRICKSRNIIQQYDTDNNLLCEYDDMKDIIKKFNMKSGSDIYKCMNGKSKSAFGYKWKYKNKQCHQKIFDNKFYPLDIINGINYTRYEINKKGQVRIVVTKYILKQRIQGGYYCIDLIQNKYKKTYLVHRLLASKFIKKEDNSYNIVNHIDENKLNNSLSNLEWTNRKNTIHSCGKKVNQININTGKIIKTFTSISEAGIAVNNGKQVTHISCVCRGRRKTAYGFKWAYA